MRDDCLYELSRSLNSYGLCFQISDANKRQLCFAGNRPDSEETCRQLETVSDRDLCYKHLQSDTQDFALCSRIADRAQRRQCYSCAGLDDEDDPDLCLVFFATKFRDSAICDLMDHAPGRQACLTQMVVPTGMPNVCQQPPDLYWFKKCREWARQQTESH